MISLTYQKHLRSYRELELVHAVHGTRSYRRRFVKVRPNELVS